MKKLLSDKKIGLALGGGAVLGAAHIGVLRALHEHDIKIDCISGTSIGAMVSCFYAFGKSLDKVQDIAIDLSWGDIAQFSFSKFGLFSNSKIESFLHNSLGEVTFSESKIPLAIIATDLCNGEKVVLKSGSVAKAVMASTCIPGIFQPVDINDTLLVDGGMVENVPISPLKDMGAEVIIAVDLNSKRTYKRPEDIVDTLINSFQFTLTAAAKVQTMEADVLISPDLSSFNSVDIDQTEELIEAGYQETMKMIDSTKDE